VIGRSRAGSAAVAVVGQARALTDRVIVALGSIGLRGLDASPGPGMQPEIIQIEDHQRKIMRVVVDYDRCESNGLCMALAPEVFEIRDDDVMYLLVDEPSEASMAKVREAVRMCPKQALTLVE
jgi:ferredoxin